MIFVRLGCRNVFKSLQGSETLMLRLDAGGRADLVSFRGAGYIEGRGRVYNCNLILSGEVVASLGSAIQLQEGPKPQRGSLTLKPDG